MPNIGSLLKEEISRLCRKEIRNQVEPLRKASTAYRHEIAALKRQMSAVERTMARLARQNASTNTVVAEKTSEQPLRFVAKGLVSLRARLGLSASELAKLIGVSDQSVYNWEHKRATPRKEQLAALAAMRTLGKKEAKARLEALGGQRLRKRKASA
jgi:DNA-binding transcriptional regulator YiaG